MITDLKTLTRQAAGGVSNRYMSHREDYTNAMADAVAVKVLQEVERQCDQRMGYPGVPSMVFATEVAQMIAQFSPSAPPEPSWADEICQNDRDCQCVNCRVSPPLAPAVEPEPNGHREVTPEEHAPWDGRSHGDCIICRVPFPCEAVGDDRQRRLWAENLIRQLPPDHEGRNSWLMNYGTAQAHEGNLPTHFVADKPIASIAIVQPSAVEPPSGGER